MADISKISPDDGSTILNVKDRNAVHWSESQGYVGKNLLNNKATTKTIQQVTFTVNDDKSVKVNGTNSGNENNLELGDVVLKAGKYIVSGTGFNSNTLSYQITDYPVTKQLFRIYNGDTEITLENDTHILVRLVISQGGTYSNHTVYPMIRLSSISDSTYEPYLMTNQELTEHVKQIIKTGWNSEFTITVDGAGSGTTLALVVSVLGIGVIGFSGGKLNYATIWAASSQSITASEASETGIKLTTSSTTTLGLIPLSPISGKWSIT